LFFKFFEFFFSIIEHTLIEGQKIISGATEEEVGKMEITNQLVSFGDLGGVKPSIDGNNEDCLAEIVTYAHNSYPTDPLDFGGLVSANAIKAKFKLVSIY
jgi:hypothetical protein